MKVPNGHKPMRDWVVKTRLMIHDGSVCPAAVDHLDHMNHHEMTLISICTHRSLDKYFCLPTKMPLAPPTLRYPIGETVVPGDRLCSSRQVQAGPGTRVVGGQISATLVGKVQLDASDNDGGSNGPSYTCRVETSTTAKSAVLKVGQLVIGRVVRITPQNAIVEICFMEGLGPPPQALEGAIRMEDIRTGASEQVPIEDCFQPSDMVACRVISLGDSRRYYLSTAETELGVLRATCRTSGQRMIPISWKEMQCPSTGVVELRKCAKPGGPANKESVEVQR